MKTAAIKAELEKLIAEHRAKGVERLPSERSLAERFGCARATMVKVLGDLEVEGLVIRKTGSGTFVRMSEEPKSLCIGLLMRLTYQSADDHFRSIVDSLREYADGHNIRLQLFDNLGDVAPEDYDSCAPVTAYRRGEVDGFLLLSRIGLSFAGMIAGVAPVISVNNIFGDGQEIPAVTCDYFRSGFLAGRYLTKFNHKRIAYLTEDANHPETFRELSGFQSALETANICFSEKDILDTRQTPEIFFRRCADFFTAGDYTACFLRNLNMVRPLLACFKTLQIRVPKDISIIAAGDYSHLRERDPGTTVIDTRLKDIGKTAIEMITDKVQNNKTKAPAFRLLEPRLIERSSVQRKD